MPVPDLRFLTSRFVKQCTAAYVDLWYLVFIYLFLFFSYGSFRKQKHPIREDDRLVTKGNFRSNGHPRMTARCRTGQISSAMAETHPEWLSFLHSGLQNIRSLYLSNAKKSMRKDSVLKTLFWWRNSKRDKRKQLILLRLTGYNPSNVGLWLHVLKITTQFYFIMKGTLEQTTRGLNINQRTI